MEPITRKRKEFLAKESLRILASIEEQIMKECNSDTEVKYLQNSILALLNVDKISIETAGHC